MLKNGSSRPGARMCVADGTVQPCLQGKIHGQRVAVVEVSTLLARTIKMTKTRTKTKMKRVQ